MCHEHNKVRDCNNKVLQREHLQRRGKTVPSDTTILDSYAHGRVSPGNTRVQYQAEAATKTPGYLVPWVTFQENELLLLPLHNVKAYHHSSTITDYQPTKSANTYQGMYWYDYDMYWYDYDMYWYDYDMYWCDYDMYWYDYYIYWHHRSVNSGGQG